MFSLSKKIFPADASIKVAEDYDLTLRNKSAQENITSAKLNSCHGHFHFPSIVSIYMEIR